MVNTQNLSAECKELLRLCPLEDRGDVALVIKDHPELVSGLNEYVECVKQDGKAIAQQDEAPKTPHSASKAASEIQRPPRT